MTSARQDLLRGAASILEPAIAVAQFIVSADGERSPRCYTEVLGGVTVATMPVRSAPFSARPVIQSP